MTSVIAEYAVAQQDLLSGRTLVEGIGKALNERTYKVGVHDQNKAAMLLYLTDVGTLLARSLSFVLLAFRGVLGRVFCASGEVVGV